MALQRLGQRDRGGQGGVERLFQPALAQHAQAGLADALGRQQRGVQGRQHGVDAQGVRDLAADLASRPAERRQGVIARIEAAFGGDAAHGLGHLLDRDGDEALGGGFRCRQAHGVGQRRQSRAGGGGIERLIAVRAEGGGEIGRIDAAQHEIGVGHRGRAAPSVAGGTGIGAGAVGAHTGASAIEEQDRAAARRDGFDIQHRRAQLGGGQFRALAALQRSGEAADIGRGAAHVEAQHGAGVCLRRRRRHPDRAAGRA